MKKIASLFAASLLFLAVSCAGSKTTESAGEMIDSSSVTTKVKTKLLRDKLVDGLDVNVDTFKDTVMLSGFVKSEQEKERAERLAANIDGVKKVVNNLKVKAE